MKRNTEREYTQTNIHALQHCNDVAKSSNRYEHLINAFTRSVLELKAITALHFTVTQYNALDISNELILLKRISFN